MALTVVKLGKADASMAQNLRVSNNSPSQNPIIRISRPALVQARTKQSPNIQIQPFKRNRTVIFEDAPAVAPKKILTSDHQLIPVQTIPSSKLLSTDMVHKLTDNTEIKFKTGSGTTLKVASGNKQYGLPVTPANGAMTTLNQIRRPTVLLKPPIKRSIRATTMELIEKSPELHVGISAEHLSILKRTVCVLANIPIVDLYLTLKKLRCNEDFNILAEYFEYSDDRTEVINKFIATIEKLSKYLKFMIKWPKEKKYCDRQKNLPIPFRYKSSIVQSLVDCVETEIKPIPSLPNLKSYKFIIAMTPSGFITYVSQACVGHKDDITVFDACKFREAIPSIYTLVSDPGPLIPKENIGKSKKEDKKKQMEKGTPSSFNKKEQTRERASKPSTSHGIVDFTKFNCKDYEEIDIFDEHEHEIDKDQLYRYIQTNPLKNYSNNTMRVVNSYLTSKKVNDVNIPTVHVKDDICRAQLSTVINEMREFKVLQPHSDLEPQLYRYLNEILIVVTALVNFQR